ncbi:MAG: nucleotidyltransferase domain-containing protein [Burkholderiales bacterium]
MGRTRKDIAEALFSRTQQEVLGLLFARPERRFYLGEIVRAARKGTGAVHRELARLAGAGLVTLLASGGKKLYQANRASPVFSELAGLMAKLAGAAPALRSPPASYAVGQEPAVPRAKLAALCRKYHVRRLGLFGSAARGELAPESDVGLLIEFVVGKAPSFWAEPELRAAFGALFGGRRVDLVPPAVLENPYRRKSILRDLKVLYEA